jgi:hypothetical protein
LAVAAAVNKVVKALMAVLAVAAAVMMLVRVQAQRDRAITGVAAQEIALEVVAVEGAELEVTPQRVLAQHGLMELLTPLVAQAVHQALATVQTALQIAATEVMVLSQDLDALEVMGDLVL